MNAIIFILAAVLAFAVTALLGYVAIPFLHKLKFGQTIREIGPAWHQKKNGTPTMGGIMIIIGFVFSFLACFIIAGILNNGEALDNVKQQMEIPFVFSGLGLSIGMAFIGFIDDYIKVVKKRNLGLTASQKTALQLLVSAAYLASLRMGKMTFTWIPFVGDVNIAEGAGLIFWPIALIFIYGFTNAVNLTDGLDGLASTVTMVVCSGFMLAASISGYVITNIFACAAAGACLGFLVWNSYPAKVFMGDTGSLFLGGVVVSLAFSIGRPILLIPAGIIYIIEALSVVLQVAYYKKTKKRLFKMAPIHHHFEMSGYSEQKIVVLFSAITAIGCFIALLPYLF